VLNVVGVGAEVGVSRPSLPPADGTSLTDIPDFDGPIPGTLYWDATNVVTSPAYDTSNSGANWNGPFSQNLYMKATAVPEPSACMMALAGLACGGYLVRHRRKRD